jgi:asparagine synthase (glutamine-hydrolysing)
MCGIAGIVCKGGIAAAAETLPAAIACLGHRGPQGRAVWVNETGTAALAHSRLSIIDTSEAGAQPMHFDGRYTIIHNGELYNYIEIRKELLQKNYVFHTASDTEVIVAAYDAWGPDCLQRFDGMFAFAIWDEQGQQLFAARDRMGEKPFFFCYDETRLCFASETKALWKLGVERQVNRSMLYNFLTIGYTTNPGDRGETFFDKVFKLPAASYLTYSLSSHQLQVEQYWQVDMEINHHISEIKAIETFDALFAASIKRRLRSDVPIGTSLSGGLDSSAVVAYCDGMAPEQYSHQCFTASFEGFEKDETAYAKRVAKQYGLHHHLVRVEKDEVLALMNRAMQAQEEPFSSGSVLAQLKVYEAAKDAGVTVLLDGQGADELLAGYSKYHAWYWRELYQAGRLDTSGELKAARANGVTDTFSWAQKIASRFPEFAASMQQSRKAKQAFQSAFLDREFAFTYKRSLYYSLPSQFDLNGVLYFNAFVSGLEELLRLADRNSMAHSTEVRLPFLSHELVAFLFTLPPQLKIHKGWTKWILRKAVEQKLPASIVWRKDKVGFEPPQEAWMKIPEVQEAIIAGKKKLVAEHILHPSVLKNPRPHSAYADGGLDWKCWSASYLFGD